MYSSILFVILLTLLLYFGSKSTLCHEWATFNGTEPNRPELQDPGEFSKLFSKLSNSKRLLHGDKIRRWKSKLLAKVSSTLSSARREMLSNYIHMNTPGYGPSTILGELFGEEEETNEGTAENFANVASADDIVNYRTNKLDLSKKLSDDTIANDISWKTKPRRTKSHHVKKKFGGNKTTRRKHKREASSGLGFLCIDKLNDKKLNDLWTADNSVAVLEYIEMANIASDAEKCPANCTMQVDNERMAQKVFWDMFVRESASIVQMANTLNSVFRVHTDKPAISKSVALALARSLIDSTSSIRGTEIAFESDAGTESSPVIYSFSRLSDGRLQRVLDASKDAKSRNDLNSSDKYDWYWRQKRDYSSLLDSRTDFCKPIDADSESDIAGTIVTQTDGIWSSLSFDCNEKKEWKLDYSVPFFSCDEKQSLTFRGVLKADLALGHLNINQCGTDGQGMISFGIHRCPDNSKCLPAASIGFRRGGYTCKCLPGYYYPNSSMSYFAGSEVEAAYVNKLLNQSNYYDSHFRCMPCQVGCEGCTDGSPCLIEYNILKRGIPMGIESLCITIGVALTFVIVRLRKTKVMKTSFWCLLEVVILGAILMHATVIIQYFEPTDLNCLLIPWFREVGFSVVYGALILKVYRVLAEFQSRKAHRVQVRDKDLIKYLICIVVVVIGYMAAWTAVTLDGDSITKSMLEFGEIQGLRYSMCQSTWWDYVIEIAEILFLVFGVYLCYRARSAPSSYREMRYISYVICNETVVSAVFYIARFFSKIEKWLRSAENMTMIIFLASFRHCLWLDIHPDYMFLMYFIRCQLTVSVMMLLILGPKLWYAHQPPEESGNRTRAYSSSEPQDNVSPEVVKLNTTINPNGDVEVGEINLSDMNPDDIRYELKRLYTQLQIYKTKTMRQDNPHISKRRGGRKQTHRRFSLQAFHNKHKRHHSEHGEHGGGDTEVSRTPEESTNSAEGVSVYMDESSVADTRIPSVTFKSSGLKGK